MDHGSDIVVPGSSPASSDSSPGMHNLARSIEDVILEPLKQPRFLGQSSGISFAKLVMTAIQVDQLPASFPPEERSGRVDTVPALAESTLPPKHAANHLEDVYFQYRTPHMPILSRSQVRQAISRAYCPLGDGEVVDDLHAKSIFTAYMVFAIALADIPHAFKPNSRPSESEGCFSSALSWLEQTLTHSKSDLETLRVVLLLTQFVALSPSRGSLWHLAGFAMRLCIDTGLHWESESQCSGMAPDVLDDRRRLWHSTYHFDRLLCITLGRPFSVLDQGTRVPLPSPWTGSRLRIGVQSGDFDIQMQRAHNHLFTLAKLESEIRHVQHSQSWASKLAYPRPNWAAWLQDIQPRLQEWYDTIPEPSKAHESSIFACKAYWEVVYYNTVLTLHRPGSTCRTPQTEEMLLTFEASCKVIDGLEVLQRQGRVEMLWRSVQQLFMAGLGVIHALWHSKNVRDRTTVPQWTSILQSCASTLTAMSKSFQGAVGCRNALEALTATTIKSLGTPSSDEQLQTAVEFEHHARELITPLIFNPTSASATSNSLEGDISSILSSNAFPLSGFLSMTAQWPGLGDIDPCLVE